MKPGIAHDPENPAPRRNHLQELRGDDRSEREAEKREPALLRTL